MMAYQEWAVMHGDGIVDEFHVFRSRRMAIARAQDLDDDCDHGNCAGDRRRHETIVRDISQWRVT